MKTLIQKGKDLHEKTSDIANYGVCVIFSRYRTSSIGSIVFALNGIKEEREREQKRQTTKIVTPRKETECDCENMQISCATRFIKKSFHVCAIVMCVYT